MAAKSGIPASASEEPTVPLKEYLEALRISDKNFHDERDRRYTEVKNAEEKALRIKEQADRDALGLAREIQTYKDEKANELREQISSERGLYASKDDVAAAVGKIEATLTPIASFVAAQQGRITGSLDTRSLVFSLFGLVGIILGAIAFIINNT